MLAVMWEKKRIYHMPNMRFFHIWMWTMCMKSLFPKTKIIHLAQSSNSQCKCNCLLWKNVTPHHPKTPHPNPPRSPFSLPKNKIQALPSYQICIS
jgi:hypothetical protein